MPAATAKNIAEWFRIDADKAKAIAATLKAADSVEAVDAALAYADQMLEAHGIEALRGGEGYHVSRYYGDIVALYVNTGDAYTATIIYETEPRRFHVWTYGDFVEKKQRKYKFE
jgi:hypothetical protein